MSLVPIESERNEWMVFIDFQLLINVILSSLPSPTIFFRSTYFLKAARHTTCPLTVADGQANSLGDIFFLSFKSDFSNQQTELSLSLSLIFYSSSSSFSPFLFLSRPSECKQQFLCPDFLQIEAASQIAGKPVPSFPSLLLLFDRNVLVKKEQAKLCSRAYMIREMGGWMNNKTSPSSLLLRSPTLNLV